MQTLRKSSIEQELEILTNSFSAVKNALLADWLSYRRNQLILENKEHLADQLGLSVQWHELLFSEHGYTYYYGYQELDGSVLPALARLEEVGRYYYLKQLKHLLKVLDNLDEVDTMHVSQVRIWLHTYLDLGVALPGEIDVAPHTIQYSRRLLKNILTYIQLYPLENI